MSAHPTLPRFGILTILFASTLTVMSSVLIAPALPLMQAAFAGTPGAELMVPLVLTLPALTLALCAPFAGWVIDRYGRRTVLLVGTVLYSVVGVLPIWLDTLPTMLASRALMGVCEAAIMTSCITLLSDYHDENQRSRIFGVQSAFMAGGGIVFQLLGGLFADYHWRGPFLIYGWAIVLVPLIWRYVPEPPRLGRAERVPSAGSSLAPADRFPVGTMVLVYGLTFLGMLAFYVIPVQIPFYLIELGETRPSMAGLAGAQGVVVCVFSALAFRWIHARLGELGTTALMFLGLAAGLALISAADDFLSVSIGILVCGLGAGLVMPNFTLWINNAVPASLRGRANGGLSTATFLSQFVCPILSLAIAARVGGLSGAFLVLAVGLLLISASVAVAWIFGPRRWRFAHGTATG